MSIRKQFEDAAKCCKNPIENDECICELFKRTGGVSSICAERSAQTALAYRELAIDLFDAGNNYCPGCDSSTGHKPGCKYVKLLEREGLKDETDR